MATILLAGATGTVGSYLLPLLKKEGHKVVSLVRPKGNQNPNDRVEGDVLAGDIAQPNCGLTDGDIKRWEGKIDKVVNSAACLKFLETHAEEARQVNVDGVRNLLDLAEKLGVPEFHQVSTAYVAGGTSWFIEDAIPVPGDGRNVYERTKAKGENLARAWKRGKYSIYRLGIVMGDSQTGYASAFNGYYVFAAALWHLKQNLLSMKYEDLEKYEAEGIFFDENGDLNLPIRINFSATSTLNLTPIDWTCEMLAKLITRNASNRTYHLVNPNPAKIRWINDVSLQSFLGIKGYYYGKPVDCSCQPLLKKLQRIFDRVTAQYAPYVTHEPEFEVINAAWVLGKDFVWLPKLDKEMIGKMLNYAKSVNFGREEQSTKAVRV